MSIQCSRLWNIILLTADKRSITNIYTSTHLYARCTTCHHCWRTWFFFLLFWFGNINKHYILGLWEWLYYFSLENTGGCVRPCCALILLVLVCKRFIIASVLHRPPGSISEITFQHTESLVCLNVCCCEGAHPLDGGRPPERETHL